MPFWLPPMFFTVGLILGFNGVVELSARKRTGAWKEGGAAALGGAIIAGVSLSYVMSSPQSWGDKLWAVMFALILVGLVLVFNGLVQLSARNRTGPWKEGGASLLGGVILVGASLVAGVLGQGTIEYLLLAGLVLVFNGVVQLGVRKKTGPWKEGGASLLAGAVLVGGTIVPWRVLGTEGQILLLCSVAGLIVLFSGLVQVSVRKKTGKWKEGGASVLAGVIVAVPLPIFWLVWFLVTVSQ